MQKLDNGLVKAEVPQNYDIVMVSKVKSGRKVYHCGVYFEGMVSHADRECKQVRLVPLAEFKAGYEEPTFWR